MPRRKKQEEQFPEPPPDYYGSLEYGMDDYDDPLDKMTPDEIRQLADYVEMMQGGRYTDNFEDGSDSDDDNQAIMHLLLTLSTPGIIQTTQMMKNKKIKIKDKR